MCVCLRFNPLVHRRICLLGIGYKCTKAMTLISAGKSKTLDVCIQENKLQNFPGCFLLLIDVKLKSSNQHVLE